jgi:hypothetical protein
VRIVVATVAALAVLTPSAHALGIGVGTAPGGLSPFRPGATATASGTMIVTTASSNWTLQVTDGTAGTTSPGHLKRGAACTSGVSYLANPLTITTTALVGTASSTGAQGLGASAQTVATGPPTVSTTLTTSFSQAIGADEVLQQGCVYTATVTFSLF